VTELPSRWVEVGLPLVCEKITDGTHHSPTNLPTGQFRYVTAKNIRSWGLDLNDISYVDAETHREIYARCPVEKGDILYIKDGATTGLAVVNPLDEPFSMLSSVALIKPNRTLLESVYLKYWLNSPETLQAMLKQMTGTAIRRLTLTTICAQSVPLPPLPEQRRIVAKIDSLTGKSKRARDRLDHIPRLVEKYKQAVLGAQLSTSERKEVVRFGDIANLLNGDRGKEYPSDDEQLPKGHCLFLGTRNVRQGYFDLSQVSFISKQKHLALRGGTMKRGDIVMTIRGTLGNCAVYDESVPYDPVRVNSAMIIVRSSAEAIPAFLMWTIRSPIFLGWVNSNARGSAQPHLRGKDIDETRIYFPDVEKQRAVVATIERAFAWIDRLAIEATSARKLVDRLDQAILAKAFRGELVSQDPNDEPASVLLDRIKAGRNAQEGASSTKRTRSKLGKTISIG
jgi:type I restriction enzyme S subunit